MKKTMALASLLATLMSAGAAFADTLVTCACSGVTVIATESASVWTPPPPLHPVSLVTTSSVVGPW